MEQIRVSLTYGPCTSSVTKYVADVPSCIEALFIEEDKLKISRSHPVSMIELSVREPGGSRETGVRGVKDAI